MNTTNSTMSRVYTVAELIAAAYVARENCAKSGNDLWRDKWDKILMWLEGSYIPSGGGFDSGTKIVRASAGEIVFTTALHHMTDVGFYDGWTEHTVRVRAEFGNGLDIRVSGRDRNGIKDYIAECFAADLGRKVQFDGEGNVLTAAVNI